MWITMNSDKYALNLIKSSNINFYIQFRAIIASICLCINEGKSLLIIDKFLQQKHTTNFCPISHVIHLPSLNDYLKKYNLTVGDGFTTNIFNLGIKVILVGPILFSIFENEENYKIINEIYENIKFTPQLVNPSLQYIQTVLTYNKQPTFNVVYLELDSDYISHWAKENFMTEHTFITYMTQQYIGLIKTHIKKEDVTFVLTSREKNLVSEFLKIQGYNHYYFKKNGNHGSEIKSAMDFIIGKRCNHIFIGCVKSGFSELLIKMLPLSVTKMCCNLESIEKGVTHICI